MARTNSPVTWAVILSQSQFRSTSMRPSWMRVYEAAGLVLSDPAGSLGGRRLENPGPPTFRFVDSHHRFGPAIRRV